MKKIIKGTEPNSLTAYRSSISASNMKNKTIYEDYRKKDVLRRQLLDEQGYICCYCMSRIGERNSKIEHFKPQSKFRKFQIAYSNLFIACKGGDGTQERFCDTKKDNQELNCIDLLSENNIKFFINGKISSESTTQKIMSDLTKEMNEVLNLNSEILVKNRKQTYDDFKNNMKSKWTKSKLQKAINGYKNKQDGKYAPYSEMMVYLLSKKLKAS